MNVFSTFKSVEYANIKSSIIPVCYCKRIKIKKRIKINKRFKKCKRKKISILITIAKERGGYEK